MVLSVSSILEVLGVATRLGLTSFGGPIAHFGYFRDEYVVRRKWLDERSYADLVALCQFLPGPASSQVGMAIGVARAGLLDKLLRRGIKCVDAVRLVRVRGRRDRGSKRSGPYRRTSA
jgi:chromate transport protein ChrA